VEAGSNTSIVTLRVIGGEEKGSLEFGAVKYDHVTWDSLSKMAALMRASRNLKL
jgi:hypothetical protein